MYTAYTAEEETKGVGGGREKAEGRRLKMEDGGWRMEDGEERCRGSVGMARVRIIRMDGLVGKWFSGMEGNKVHV